MHLSAWRGVTETALIEIDIALRRRIDSDLQPPTKPDVRSFPRAIGTYLDATIIDLVDSPKQPLRADCRLPVGELAFLPTATHLRIAGSVPDALTIVE